MRSAEFNKLMKPYRKRIIALRKEMDDKFKDFFVDEEDPSKRLSENQADRLDAVLEALCDAEQNA